MIRRALILWLLFGSAAYSQSKVGTTGAQFLELPLSVRSAGMGNVGAVFVDGRSYHVNPGTLGFIAPFRASLQLDPLVPDLTGTEVEYYSISGASRIKSGESGGPAICIGARHLRLTSPSMAERTYEEAVDTDGREFALTDTKAGMAIGLGWSGKIDFGIGAGMNYVGEDAGGYHADSWSADLGAYFGIPLLSDKGSSLKPPRILIGAALCNLGPGFEPNGRTVELPHYFRLGLGTELVWQGGGREQLRVTPAVEYQNRFGSLRREFANLGLEIRVQELLSGRIGHQWLAGADQDIATWGLGFSTAGLRGHSGGQEAGGQGTLDFIFNDIDLQVSYAHQSSPYEWREATDYYGVELLF